MEECRNNKSDLFYCFVDFRRAFDIFPRTKIWKRLEEIMIPLELMVVVTRLYEKAIVERN